MNAVYFVKRALYSIFSLWAIVTLTFMLFRMLPGDPASMMLDPLMDPSRKEVLIERFGLDRPLYIQYFDYFTSLFSGEMGSSFVSREPVTVALNPALLNSLVLGTSMFIVSYGLGSILGALLAWNRGTAFERVGVNVALTMKGAPVFFVGIALIMIFAIKLPWFPAQGLRSTFEQETHWKIFFTWDFLRHVSLPLATGVFCTLSSPTLIMRSAMLDVTQAEFLDLSRAKGLSNFALVFRHAYRNAILPLVAEASQFYAYAIGGLVTIETVFAWPGLGREIVEALLNRDYPLAQGAFLYLGALVIFAFLVSDMAAAYLDPRVRRVERTLT